LTATTREAAIRSHEVEVIFELEVLDPAVMSHIELRREA
jgi:hypothetical protein